MALSAVLIVALIYYGLPLLFNLTVAISGLRPKGTISPASETGIAPNTPRISENLEATKSALIKVSGVADPRTTVQLWQNGQNVSNDFVGDDGVFSFDVTLNPGLNSFRALSVNSNGQKSDLSETYSVTLNSQPPKLEITNPKDGDSFTDSPIMINGKTDGTATVTVNDRFAIVNSDGSFSFAYNPQQNGDNKLKIVATDDAGNQTTKEMTVKFNP